MAPAWKHEEFPFPYAKSLKVSKTQHKTHKPILVFKRDLDLLTTAQVNDKLKGFELVDHFTFERHVF